MSETLKQIQAIVERVFESVSEFEVRGADGVDSAQVEEDLTDVSSDAIEVALNHLVQVGRLDLTDDEPPLYRVGAAVMGDE